MKSAVCALLVTMTTAKRMGPFPTSCIDQEDGYQWLKLLSSGHIHNDYPLVWQKCDQEYIIIDPHEDPNIMDYVVHDDDSVVSWEQWWTPNVEWAASQWTGDKDDYFYYAISPDCNTCDVTSGHQTAYFVFTSFDCKHSARGMALFSALTRDGVKPAVGNDGTHCVCVKPADSYSSMLLDETSFHYDDAVEDHNEFLESRKDPTSLAGKYHWNAAYTECENVEVPAGVMAVETVKSGGSTSSMKWTLPLVLSVLTVIVAVIAMAVWCYIGSKRLKSVSGDNESSHLNAPSVYVPYH